MLESFGSKADKSTLGNVISTWKYSAKKSSKFLFTAITVIGGLLITFIYYFDHLLPFLKNIPSIVIYGLVFLISPLLKYFTGKGKNQIWTLYEHGYSVLYEGKTGGGEERFGFWRDYTTCSYDSSGVKLISGNPLKKSLKIPTIGNVTEVYSIARERISMASAEKLDKAVKVPGRPRTKEQRQLLKAEMRTHKVHQAERDTWKNKFGHSSKG
jgi:hypothetical protein